MERAPPHPPSPPPPAPTDSSSSSSSSSPKSPSSSWGTPRRTHSVLTFSRSNLIKLALETVQIARDGKYTNGHGHVVNVSEALGRAMKGSVHYHYDHVFPPFGEEEEDDGDGGTEEVEGGDDDDEGGDNDAPGDGEETGRRRSRRTKRVGNKETKFEVTYGSSLTCAADLLDRRQRDDPPSQPNLDDDDDNNNVVADDDATPPPHNTIKVGILNSASGRTPGGGFFRGTVSHEDCLCRASLLYPCLTRYDVGDPRQYYEINKRRADEGKGSTSCAIYCPDVPVIREDTVEGKLLEEVRYVSFVSIPAANAFTSADDVNNKGGNAVTDDDDSDDDDVKNDIKDDDVGRRNEDDTTGDDTTTTNNNNNPNDNDNDSHDDDTKCNRREQRRLALCQAASDRIRRALSIFALHGCTHLVLSAFGCGVHGNDPVMVATEFRNQLKTEFDGVFDTVVFAIQPSRKANYRAFVEAFLPKNSKETKEEIKSTSSTPLSSSNRSLSQAGSPPRQ